MKWSDKRAWVEDGFAKWALEPVALEPIDEAGVKAQAKNEGGKKLRLVNVWATWCGPCVIEFPDLVSLHRIYRGRDFEVVTVNADDPEKRDKALEFLKTAAGLDAELRLRQGRPLRAHRGGGSEVAGWLAAHDPGRPGGRGDLPQRGRLRHAGAAPAIVGWLGRYYHSTPGGK